MILLVLTPSLVLKDVDGDTKQIVLLVALVGAIFTFMEYRTEYPSMIEFRDAPPFNRVRFVALFLTVFVLSVVARGEMHPSTLTELLTVIGNRIAETIDVPYSPVRLMVLMLPEGADADLIAELRTAAGVAYTVSIISLGAFVLSLRLGNWPLGARRSFNLWTNLPTFDPNAGRDVVARLNRDAGVNLVLGFLLPFLIPAVVKLATDVANPIGIDQPHTMIWTVTAWAFVPASLLMRGIALSKVAQMIEAQRVRRAGEPGAVPAT